MSGKSRRFAKKVMGPTLRETLLYGNGGELWQRCWKIRGWFSSDRHNLCQTFCLQTFVHNVCRNSRLLIYLKLHCCLLSNLLSSDSSRSWSEAFHTIEKVSRLFKKVQPDQKLSRESRKSGNFSNCQETFQTVRTNCPKCPDTSQIGNFSYCPETFLIIQKLSVS